MLLSPLGSQAYGLVRVAAISVVTAVFLVIRSPVLPFDDLANAQCGCPDYCDGSCDLGENCFVQGPTDWCTYPATGCPTGQTNDGGCCVTYTSPVIIDVAGDGFELTNRAAGVLFAITGTRERIQISWTEPHADDAWLALDRNGDGLIDNGLELFGNFTAQPDPQPGNQRNGFAALAEFDQAANGGNGDGLIDEHDSVFARLRLWQDRNHNGVSEPRELHSLLDLGVSAISLAYKDSHRVDQYGNAFRFRAKVFGARHSDVGRWAFDVFLIGS
jgi:hypothetical protein